MAQFEGEKGKKMGGKAIEIKDNTQAGEVRDINTMAQNQDISRIRPYKSGSKGYPAEAWNYKY